jgi:hypothetical protein
MTQVKIDLNPTTSQSAINSILAVQLKLEKIVAALQHTNAAPDYKYLINYMVGPVGMAVTVSSTELSMEACQLGQRLAAAGVLQLNHEDPYAEISLGTLDWMIDEKIRDNTLVIKGADIRYHPATSGKKRTWETLPDNVSIVVTRLALTDEDHKEFRERQLKEALGAVVKMGYTIDEAGVLTVI